MTYLDAVNRVLRLLRENEVSQVAANSYSKLIGEFVNYAKEEVEDAWDWTMLRTPITVTTAASTSGYSITGTSPRARILNIYNDTDDYFLTKIPYTTIKQYLNYNDVQNGEMTYYAPSGIDSSDAITIELYPIPDAVYSIIAEVVNPSARLASDADTFSVPSTPVIWGAYAKAIEERGEAGAISATSAVNEYQKALSRSIFYDADRTAGELYFNVD